MSATAVQTIPGTPAPLETVQPTPTSELDTFFDAPILIIRTSQASTTTTATAQAAAEKDVAALSPETRAVAHQTVDPAPSPAPATASAPATSSTPETTAAVQSTTGAADMERQPTVGVGRVRSLLKKRRSLKAKNEPEPAPATATSAPAETSAQPTASPEKSTLQSDISPTATITATTSSKLAHSPSADEKSHKDIPATALAMPATTAAIAARAPTIVGAADSKPVGADDNEEDLSNAVLSRSYGHGTTARSHSPAPSRRSKRASVRTVPAPAPAPAAAPAPEPAPLSRPASRAASRPHSRASARPETVYDTASGDDGTASEAGSDEDEEASYLSPVSHHRARTAPALAPSQAAATTKAARRTSAPPSRRSVRSDEPRPRAGSERGHSRRAQSVSGRSVAARSTVSGAFGSGAGTIGPAAVLAAEEAAPYTQRGLAAVPGLSEKQVKRIGKEELKEGKKLSKILKQEGKVERQALEVAMKELSELQAMQKKAIKEESRAHTAHAKALKAAHDAELVFLDAQRRLQVAQADLRAKADALDAGRAHAQGTTARVQEKNREVELLRAQKGADSREREAKMRRLVGKA